MDINYELGLQRLRAAFLRKSPSLPADFPLLEMRLVRNLQEGRRYGSDDPGNRAEFNRIMDGLIQLADDQLGVSFLDLCRVGAHTQQDMPSISPLKEQVEIKGEYTRSKLVHYNGTGEQWAVLVGANVYEDKLCYPRLHVCTKDAVAISQRFIENGFLANHVSVLADNATYSPTRENILATLKTVADATQPDDLLLFYYSGHGDQDGSESYLVARNGRMAFLEGTAIPIRMVKELMQRAAARAKVLILDACHIGAAIGGKGPRRMQPEFIRRVFTQAEGLAILASCTQNQLSYEWRKQERSVFTYYLLEALQGLADNDEKGFVTVSDIHRYVTNGVGEWAAQHRVIQSPTLQAEMAGEILVSYWKP
jgi:hypothetical protein